MLLQPQPPDSERAGDRARRRARYAVFAFLVGLPASLWLFARLPEIWALVMPMQGAPFLLAATALGAALAVAPVATALAALLAVWFGVESVYLPRSRPSPLTDRVIIALGLLTWFAPTGALVAAAARAVMEGRIHFPRPPRDYYLATDPIAFWQGVGFWLIVAAAIAYPAWRYWRAKLVRPR
jgi:hypothetical protein